MADEKCESPQQPQSASQPAAAEGAHMVKCVKFGREMPGLDRPPWKGELGQRIYDNVSKEGWKMWIEHSKMIMNEYRLNPLEPQSQKIIAEQMENFFFGEGAQLPPGYVAQKSKS
jgi:Fe-S cluster biosynthesis and repair protein YggX